MNAVKLPYYGYHTGWKNHYNTKPDPGQINTMPSQTIPDQGMSIEEIIKRSVAGLPLSGQRIPFFSEDPENDLLQGVNPATLDISELQDLKKFANDRIKLLREEIKDQQQQIEEAEKLKNEQKVLENVPTKVDQGTTVTPG